MNQWINQFLVFGLFININGKLNKYKTTNTTKLLNITNTTKHKYKLNKYWYITYKIW